MARGDLRPARRLFAIAKILLFAFPLFWTVRVDGGRLSLPKPRWTGILPGIVTGAVIGAAGIVLYKLVYADVLDPAPLRSQAVRLGFLQHYWLLALGWSLLNSAYEEYAWRWFVFGQCPKLHTIKASGAFMP